MGRYPRADWRPLPGRTVRPCRPRILVFHTMSGYLRGSESTFKRSNLESHFGVGGPNDPAGLDGVVWQWVDTGQQADAQAGGNGYCTSVETSDGARPERPWSTHQLEALIDLGVWWCRTHDHPARLVNTTGEAGFGYHRQFRVWNPNGHGCPGAVREAQLVQIVIPNVASCLGGKPPQQTHPSEEDDLTPEQAKQLAAIATKVDEVEAKLGRMGTDNARLKARLGIGDQQDPKTIEPMEGAK